jgi:hypothetical protein
MIAPTLASDLAYGTSNERTHKQTLEEFFKKSLTHRGGYSTFDYDDGATLFVELKSRRIRHDKYPTAIIGANKVATARENPTRSYWFCYAYQDGIYGIPYSQAEFDTFECSEYSRGEREDFHNKPQVCYFIPSDRLQRLS